MTSYDLLPAGSNAWLAFIGVYSTVCLFFIVVALAWQTVHWETWAIIVAGEFQIIKWTPLLIRKWLTNDKLLLASFKKKQNSYNIWSTHPVIDVYWHLWPVETFWNGFTCFCLPTVSLSGAGMKTRESSVGFIVPTHYLCRDRPGRAFVMLVKQLLP